MGEAGTLETLSARRCSRQSVAAVVAIATDDHSSRRTSASECLAQQRGGA